MSSPAADPHLWRALGRSVSPEEPPKGLDGLWHKAKGALKRRALTTASFLARAETILSLESGYSRQSDARLRAKAELLRALLRRGRETAEDVNHACAVIREGSMRTFGFRHHAVQVAGALAMYGGCVAEMATGEGKTLTATIPAILAGWRGRGCHVITVNDYLATRDCEEMGKLYGYFHLRSLPIPQEAKPDERRRAYAADITYLTNKEAAADFLRDRLALGSGGGLAAHLLSDLLGGGRQPRADGGMVQRGLEFAIVDEADSVLIDEAVTPLIISSEGKNEQQANSFAIGSGIAASLKEGRDYTVDWKYKEIEITARGRERIARKCRRLEGVWQAPRRREEIIHQALTARHFFRQGSEYILDEGKVVIVDESTGRLMPDRSWRDGLHQAVEAKEEVEVTPPKATLARVSFQRFFRLYTTLSGMTGTAGEARGEFWHVYRLPIIPIPTHKPCLRVMMRPRIFATQKDKWNEALSEIRRVHALGRPVLVGTRSIEASERLSHMLREAGLEHEVLNAVHHRREAEIVARAGHPGRITVATNMAGRGTDIKLKEKSRELGGLHVIATERHMSARIDRQLYGRSSRQGDPGSAVAILSLDDELPRRFCRWRVKLLTRTGLSGLLRPEWSLRVFSRAEKKAERMAYKQRREVLRSDTWLKEQMGFAGADL